MAAVQNSFKYDVFLSFRGEDTKFVDHLYDALTKSGISTYKDNKRIENRRKMSNEVIRFLEESRFHIIVFSTDYASSSWCLDELVKIMECQNKTKLEQTAYPVFYDVEPTQVANQNGVFGDAFARHEKEEDAWRWRYALKTAAVLNGWEWKTTVNGCEEAKFIHKIVEAIFLKPHFINRSYNVTLRKLVGMETRVKNLVSSLEIGSNDVRMIGIKGMGGSGKTALAQTVFYHIGIWFEGKSFIEDVGEASSEYYSSLKGLQKQVLEDVLDRKIDVPSVSDGKSMMKTIMLSRKVLLVLDDVDHRDQLEALAGELTWFKPGSRIIVTTRDKKVLMAKGVHSDNIHEVNMLSHEEAVCLFSRDAFGSEIPCQGYEELSSKVVSYAAGLPIAIKVLGSSLRGSSMSEWVDRMEILRALEPSYDGLEDDYKEMFLDVACILKGEKKNKAIAILESCGFNARIGLRVLEQKSLISISDDDRLLVHDQIEEMGKIIVSHFHKEPRMHSRLWDKKEIECVLVNDWGSSGIECIKLDDSDLHPAVIMNGLRSMRRLRFLYVDDQRNNWETDDVSQYLPKSLISLHWSYYPFRCLPKTFDSKFLVNLEMVGSNISQLWEEGESKVLKRLKFLNLSGSKLSNLDLTLIPNLEELYLSECNDFNELCISGECPELRVVVLGCPKLTKLNLELIPNLEVLYLEESNELIEIHLPVQPTTLTLSAKEIKHLPESICMLKHLKYLELKSCLLLEQLPQGLEGLECLEKLYLTNCISLRGIPSSICKMKCLRYLHLPYCIKVKELPEELGLLECLIELNIEGSGVRHLPHSIVQLRHIHITGSRGRLESYGFTSLKEISTYTASC